MTGWLYIYRAILIRESKAFVVVVFFAKQKRKEKNQARKNKSTEFIYKTKIMDSE